MRGLLRVGARIELGLGLGILHIYKESPNSLMGGWEEYSSRVFIKTDHWKRTDKLNI
jgi:hypothetical protein